ncbi:PAS domain-containing hybrid sensor histidine kinase/response regulator [uncultured Chitinophaga sp.]|uniref:PAS domain-containing hybrid sensor histidine kinase/response regulator n=1 Tax=uncultured Chitinophaga sp. TaxID=339340 RepID=UPI0025EEB621|nr:PAS domain-containing hybrid sensor histidine kinase/response regulator [uncultured Chitinophaga sp.]
MTSKARIERVEKRRTSALTREELPSIFALPLSTFLNNTNAGVLVSDERHHFIWVNEVFSAYFENSPLNDQQLNIPFSTLVELLSDQTVEPDLFRDKMEELRLREKPLFGWEVVFKTGHIREVSYVPVYDNDIYRGCIWQVIDVTKHRQWQEEVKRTDEKYRIILDNLNAAVCETDLDGNITKVYDSFPRLTGYSKEEVIGKNITDLFVPDERDREKARRLRRQRIEKDVPTLYDIEIVLRDGSRKWVLASSGNLYDRDGNTVGGVGIHMDITEQKKLQKELERAKQNAEEAQKSQKEFLANMSHEIRTPLNAIIGMTHLLDETNLSDGQKEYIKILKHSSNILHGLITDILDLSKIEAGKLEVNPREFDLTKLVNSMRDSFQHKLAQRPIKLTVQFDKRLNTLLMGDDMILNQVLMNLLGNAEKFTREGEIALKVELENVQANVLWLQFKVCDTGIGIEKNKLEEVFQNYKQAEKGIREKYGGTGLGLAIAKQLVELQGGRIGIEDDPVYHTCFCFNLPFVDTRKPIRPGMPEKPDNKYAKIDFGTSKVLVVEDNPMNLKYIISLLEKYKVDYQLATNGHDALYFLNSKHFDLVLMDIRIPGMDGFELAKKIREDEDKPNVATPVIATTAAAMPSTINLARSIGITDILTKPYTPDQLLQVLNKYLNEDETELIMEVQNISGYEFHSGLDVKYLNTLYESNIGYAVDLFEIFVLNIREEMRKLDVISAAQDWEQLRFQVHKIKPNFSMVGLTWVTAKMETLEGLLRHNNGMDKLPELLDEVVSEVNTFFPIVEEELRKMQDFIKVNE